VSVVRRTVILLALGLVAAACSAPAHRETEADRVTPPRTGSCRDLSARDVAKPTNATPVIACSGRHTAETFAVGTLPKEAGSAYGDKRQGRFVYDTCTAGFRDYLGADESLAMRIQLSWAWFGPSERGWRKGARWYRCDVVGGAEGARQLRALPPRVRGLFSAGQPDAWLTCARGTSVATGTKVPCSQAHDWRAISTIKVGQPTDAYPGDRIVQVRSRDLCSEWIGAWSHYPADYDYGYTWFHEAEWSAGNRRSVCWARTAQ
jgi:Septum formation